MNPGGWALAVLLAVATAAVQAGPVNVNTADASTIARELHGIGLAKAQAIVAHREKHGPFRSLDDLGRVKGIGPRTLERNRDSIRLDARAAPPRPAATGAVPPARPPAASAATGRPPARASGQGGP